jgi:hypothetical protein
MIGNKNLLPEYLSRIKWTYDYIGEILKNR